MILTAIKNIFFKKKALSKDELLTNLFEKYAGKLCAYGIHTWKINEDVSWEMVYKTLYKIVSVYEKYKFDSEQQEQSFIFRTYINYLKNYFRDHKDELGHIKIDLLEEQVAEHKESDEPSEDKKLTALKSILDELEDWQRILVLMRSDGRSYGEIAEFVDKPENQLKVYYQRIKEQITKKIHGTEL